jgi:phosphoenolpyruvate carboxykinase (GTP)
MGPLGSPIAQIGVEITDSRLRRGQHADHDPHGQGGVDVLGETATRAVPPHGRRAAGAGRGRRAVAVQPDNKYIVHFPETARSGRTAAGYGGNALLGKKCFALRIASVMARDEGWLAEHMLILGVDRPEGEKTYVAAAFPSACGKTNFAMLDPAGRVRGGGRSRRSATTSPGSSRRGRPLYAINPEAGFFGVAPGTNDDDEPQRDGTIRANTIFTNVALTDDGDVWWEGMTRPAGAPHRLARQPWTPEKARPAAHPNARFTAPGGAVPGRSTRSGRPAGRADQRVHLRRPPQQHVPLVYQAFNWAYGVYLAATMGSETTAAAFGAGRRGAARPVRDAAVLRLPHGRLLQPLARFGRGRSEGPAPHLRGQLVPQGRQRQVPVARVRREHARC